MFGSGLLTINYVDITTDDAVTDPLIIVSSSIKHAWRGGAWNYHQDTLKTGIRFSEDEGKCNDHFDFRITK
ncbi:MAG: hypothetical protein ACI8XC_002475 [Gammaproteobacteria bacterium]|jgi:hypothetical protein